ncbi:hypothetical protein CDAR_379501 [Caerostris darwini]|uniref:Uncharacterized protein n=1 Tax=Caerostris darwini TaxID=1538125 RepID=A0AAV4V9P4_9ARAC|nr:hypothetical protein CDAR_379501 [Caerostris darwini]
MNTISKIAFNGIIPWMVVNRGTSLFSNCRSEAIAHCMSECCRSALALKSPCKSARQAAIIYSRFPLLWRYATLALSKHAGNRNAESYHGINFTGYNIRIISRKLFHSNSWESF